MCSTNEQANAYVLIIRNGFQLFSLNTPKIHYSPKSNKWNKLLKETTPEVREELVQWAFWKRWLYGYFLLTRYYNLAFYKLLWWSLFVLMAISNPVVDHFRTFSHYPSDFKINFVFATLFSDWRNKIAIKNLKNLYAYLYAYIKYLLIVALNIYF